MSAVTAVFLAALVAVEQGGGCVEIGDGGKARGLLQIHSVVVRDVNRFAGTSFTHWDAHRPEAAARICQLYLDHYATRERIGREPTVEDMARIWNGGPNGWKDRQRRDYGRRVANLVRVFNEESR